MDMTDALFFPSDVALAAMGNTSKRWQAHVDQGKVLVESERDAVLKGGRGRGNKRQISIDAIVQGNIALKLIDAGFDVQLAYRIGASFAYQGGAPGERLTDETAALNPVLDRFAGRLFGVGQTLLICSVVADFDLARDLAIVSDADPALSGVDGFSQAAMLIDRVGGPDDGPRVVMNLTLLCAQIAKSLDIDCQDAFGWVGS